MIPEIVANARSGARYKIVTDSLVNVRAIEAGPNCTAHGPYRALATILGIHQTNSGNLAFPMGQSSFR